LKHLLHRFISPLHNSLQSARRLPEGKDPQKRLWTCRLQRACRRGGNGIPVPIRPARVSGGAQTVTGSGSPRSSYRWN